MAQPDDDNALMQHAEPVMAGMSEGTACMTLPRTGHFSPLGNPALASQTLVDFVRKHCE